jgi:hypothetical protein
VRLDVNPNAVTVTVEGRQITQVPLLPTGTQPATGGIEITGQREKPGSSIPHVSNLVVTQH